MKITAIISEYNPYHNGHEFQKKLIKSDESSHYVIAIMSGNFTQRGEAAIFDKWTRTRLALLGGADIVLELPVLYALQSAEGFASGGVAIASGLGVIDELCFGSESAEPEKLLEAAHVLVGEGAEFKSGLKESLSKGVSFPSARSAALKRVLKQDPDVLESPNDILAVEYLKALIRSGSAIRPNIIRRAGASYHDPNIQGPVASALSIRAALKSGELGVALPAIPPSCRQAFKKYLSENKPVFPEDFFDLISYKLRLMPESELAAAAGVAEGLEIRIKKAAANAKDYAALLTGIKSKRYTHTRISRILMCCLLGITRDMLDEANTYGGLYARVLGYRRDALPVFSRLCKESRIPVVTSGTQLPQNILAKTDVLASDIYSLACADRSAGKDFTQKLIII